MSYKAYTNVNWLKAKGRPEKAYISDKTTTDAYLNTSFACLVPFMPAFGETDSSVVLTDGSAIDIAARNYYTYMRAHNASIANYTPADVIKYILAMSNVYCQYMDIAKRLSLLYKEDLFNTKWRGLRAVANVNSYDRDELANYLAQLEVIRSRINGFTLPTNISVVNRHMKLASAIYSDEPESEYESLLIFSPIPLKWQIDISDDLIGSILPTVGISNPSPQGIGAAISSLNSILELYSVDEDVAHLSSEMLKAQDYQYGRYELPIITPEYLKTNFNPVFEPNIFDEIRNATLVRPYETTAYRWGYQENINTGELKFGVNVSNNSGLGEVLTATAKYGSLAEADGAIVIPYKLSEIDKAKRILYSHEANPTPETTCVISRFASIELGVDSSHNILVAYGTEILLGIVFGMLTTAGGDQTGSIETTHMCYDFGTTADSTFFNILAGRHTLFRNKDWLPDIYVHYFLEKSREYTYPLYYGGVIDNFTDVNVQQLRNIRQVDVADLFSVLDVATQNAFKGNSSDEKPQAPGDKKQSKKKRSKKNKNKQSKQVKEPKEE